MKHIQIVCSKCQGRGHTPLSTVHQLTLNSLKAVGSATTRQLVAMAGGNGQNVTIPTMCNRMRKLVALGLVTSETIPDPTGGEMCLWSVAPTAPVVYKEIPE